MWVQSLAQEDPLEKEVAESSLPSQTSKQAFSVQPGATSCFQGQARQGEEESRG